MKQIPSKRNRARPAARNRGRPPDKSHVTVHSYPESHPDNGISTFRLDIDVSTCGHISPLKALNYLIHSFDSDIVTMDTGCVALPATSTAKSCSFDHDITSIQDYLAEDTKHAYQMIDVNVYQENMFHTKMLLKNFELDNYLSAPTQRDITFEERAISKAAAQGNAGDFTRAISTDRMTRKRKPT